MKKTVQLSLTVLLAALSIFIASCGGSGNSTTSATTARITGSIYAAPVAGASVTIKNASGETIAGPVNTTSEGTYNMDVPMSDLASDMRIESIGGTYTDEATGLTTTAVTFSAYIKGGTLTSGSAVHIDPSTTIIHELVTKHAMTLEQAQKAFNITFGYTPDTSVAPLNSAPVGTSNLQNRIAAFRAAVFSQLVKDLVLTPGKISDLLVALARDVADDGKLNGSAAEVNGTSIPEDILNHFESAIITYMTNTTSNHTAVNSADIGNLPFSKIALSPTYRVEFIPVLMSAQVGKSQFKIKVTNRIDKGPVAGLTLELLPLMHMPTKSHSSPVGAITDNNDGTYSCTAYYLMASGPGMGFWELKIIIGTESVTFYPSVGMAMGTTTVRGSLKGQNDQILSDPTGTVTENRSYYLFNDGLTGSISIGYTFNLFIAVKESLMDMPAIGNGTILHDETHAAWTISSMTVDASTDGSSWIPASEGAETGHWSVNGLSNLTSNATGTIYVRLSVGNGMAVEQKTTNGMSVSGSNGYATFIVTPGM
jgi:hypothetical protein